MTLKEARLRLGMTQLDIANRVGIHEITYAKYELYQNKPNVLMAIEIAQALHQQVGELFKAEYYERNVS